MFALIIIAEFISALAVAMLFEWFWAMGIAKGSLKSTACKTYWLLLIIVSLVSGVSGFRLLLAIPVAFFHIDLTRKAPSQRISLKRLICYACSKGMHYCQQLKDMWR